MSVTKHRTKFPPSASEISALAARLRELSRPPYDSAVFGGPMHSAAEALEHLLHKAAQQEKDIQAHARNGRELTKLLEQTEARLDQMMKDDRRQRDALHLNQRRRKGEQLDTSKGE